MSSAATLANPHRIKPKRRRVRWRTSGQTVYAYVGNNPISFVDSLGLKPGDCYPTIDVAGESAIGDINWTSIHAHAEYTGRIYQNANGTYSYTAPNKGTMASSDHGPLMPNDVGLYHTHGANDPGYDNEHFSPQDALNATAIGQPSYLGTPRGIIKKYDPATGKVINLPYPGKNNSDACGCK